MLSSGNSICKGTHWELCFGTVFFFKLDTTSLSTSDMLYLPSCALSFGQLEWYPGEYVPTVPSLEAVAEPQRAIKSGREKLLTVWPCLFQRSAAGAGFSQPPVCAYRTQTSIDYDRSRSCSSTHLSLSTPSLLLLGFSIMPPTFSLSSLSPFHSSLPLHPFLLQH